MVTYTVYMKTLGTGTSWEDVSDRVVLDDFSVRKGFGSLSDAVDVGSVSVTMRFASLADAALFHTETKQILVQAGGVTVFEGVSSDKASVGDMEQTDYVHATITFKPYSYVFDQALVPEDTIWEGLKVCDPSDTGNSILHKLFALLVANLPSPYADIVGASFSVSTTISNTKTLGLVTLEEGDSILDSLTDFLSQNGYSWYMDLFAAIVVEPYQSGRAPTVTLPVTDVVSNPSISQAPLVIDKKCVVKVPTVNEYDDDVVYQLNADTDDSSGEPTQVESLEAGESYPTDSDDEATDLDADYASDREKDGDDDSKGIELAYAKDPVLTVVAKKLSDDGNSTVDAELTIVKSELGATSAVIQLRNDLSVDVSLRNIKVVAGKAYYRDWTSGKYTDGDTSATEEDEQECLYLPSDSASAQAFIARYRAELFAEKTSVTIQTKTVIEPNTLVQVTELPYYLLVRYATRMLDGTDLYEYECVAYSVSTPLVTYTATTPSDSQLNKVTYGIKLSAPEGTVISVSGRGVVQTESLKFTAVLTNISASALVWAVDSGTLSEVDGEPLSRILDCTAVGNDKATVTVTATVDGKSYSASIGVSKVYGSVSTVNFGTVSELPTQTSDGEPLYAGDYFLAGATFTDNDVTYTKGIIYYYTGTTWAVLTSSVSGYGEKVMSLLAEFTEISDDVDSTVIGNAVIKQLFSLTIAVQNLFAQAIVLYGTEQSSNYAEWADGDDPDEDGYTGVAGEPKTGFKLDGPNSLIKAAYGILGKQFTLYGTLWNAVLKTRLAKTGSLITIPDKTYWYGQDLYDTLSSVASSISDIQYAENSNADNVDEYKSQAQNTVSALTPVTGTTAGNSLAYGTRVGTSKILWYASCYNNWGKTNSSVSANISNYATIPVDGTYKLTASKGSWGNLAVFINGVETYYLRNGSSGSLNESITLSAGDVVRLFTTINAGSELKIALALYANNTNETCFLESNGTMHEYSNSGYSTDVVSVTSPDTWDSTDNLNYVPGSSIISLVAAQVNQGVLSGCSGTVVIAGTSQSLTNILYQLTSVLLYWSSTEYQTIAAGSYYNISGSFTPEAQTAAVLTANLIPLVAADSDGNGQDIGNTNERYRKAWLKYLDVLNDVTANDVTVAGEITVKSLPVLGISGASYSSSVTNSNITINSLSSMVVNEMRLIGFDLTITASNNTTHHYIKITIPGDSSQTYWFEGTVYAGGTVVTVGDAYSIYDDGDYTNISATYSGVKHLWRKT